MRKYLLVLIFLTLCMTCFAQRGVFWMVGGANSNSSWGGGYDNTTRPATYATSATSTGNAIFVSGGPSATYTHTTKNISMVNVGRDAIEGTFMKISGTNITAGRYAITLVVDNDNVRADDIISTGDNTDTIVNIGGALPNPGDVPVADVDGFDLEPGNKVWVRGVADFTTVDASDSILYITEPGTAADPIIWEGHYAIPTGVVGEEIGDFGIVTFDATGITNPIETAIGGSVYHVFIGFSLENAIDDGANLNTVTDSYVTFIRCRFFNNGAWGIQGNNIINLAFCDLDTNTSGGLDSDASYVIGCVVRNNTGNGLFINGSTMAINNLIYDNTGTYGIYNGGGTPVIYGNTLDGNNQAGSIGIKQDISSIAWWVCTNNIITDFVTGIVEDDTTIRQGALFYNNLFNSNTTDTTGVNPVPVDGDNWGNIVKNVAENVLWTADNNTYILASAYKQGGVDASFTKAYWDDFASNNPPSGTSFMDMGSAQREEAGGGVIIIRRQ